ncbi:16S rRNA processing protein RimM [Synechococcus sp. PCC 7502]|uniref:ribosome maturation factor RimM n=1 Tax=Synechococcus sp. PCC 7502 TaxID=1173263 RepID=UPI00029FF1BA|nr:ribosome maturation factor RimM [Synechococcus sp. PCC 7502]AFY75403.1 16S rRNA processing protein RimM [Synechococcus sp. PCC 7502]
MTEWIVIGKIVSTQGLKGEVRVLSYSDFPERFEKAGKRWISKSETATPEPIELIHGRDVPGKISLYVVKLGGIDTCDAAEALRGNLLMVQDSDRPKLAKNEYHVTDLIGCKVIHQPTGKYLGIVIDVLPGGNDLLEVQNDNQEKVLIPFVEAIAPVVNIREKYIEITPPNGLVDHWLI